MLESQLFRGPTLKRSADLRQDEPGSAIRIQISAG